MRKFDQAIDYDHSRNMHSASGPQVAVPILFADGRPSSLLDVGCGVGTWLSAARDFGISDFLGIEGVDIPTSELLVPSGNVLKQDLTAPWRLGRKFDAVICFEVAEHLNGSSGPILIDCLAAHGDLIYFSAASPGQDGQHHVNCQWPRYWQELFNSHGYVCSDAIRWRIWENAGIEPWYRQNIFCARRDESLAGKEPRIQPVIHPDMIPFVFEQDRLRAHVEQIESGLMRTSWYAKAFASAVANKVKRRIGST